MRTRYKLIKDFGGERCTVDYDIAPGATPFDCAATHIRLLDITQLPVLCTIHGKPVTSWDQIEEGELLLLCSYKKDVDYSKVTHGK